MHALALILAAMAAPLPFGGDRAAASPVRGAIASSRSIPTSTPTSTSTSASTPNATQTKIPTSSNPSENLLAGPARCVLRYLEAVRHAGPRPEGRTARLPAPREKDYTRVRALTAPRTLEEIERRAAAGEDHPLAPWREAARARVLESFQLVAVRRASHGAAVVTVAERFWRPPGEGLERGVSEYLVGRVRGEWRVIDRSPGRAFDDAVLPERYAGFFDDPAAAR